MHNRARTDGNRSKAEWQPKGTDAESSGNHRAPKQNRGEHKGSPKGTQREPKGNPKGTKGNPKGSRMGGKGAEAEGRRVKTGRATGEKQYEKRDGKGRGFCAQGGATPYLDAATP